MKMSRQSRRLERHQRMRARAVSLNIVSMIDVFAVLVFFLLVSSSITAAKLNVINLNLPSPDQQTTPDKPPLQLTITRSEEHTSELQSLMRISYAVFCLKKKKQQHKTQ